MLQIIGVSVDMLCRGRTPVRPADPVNSTVKRDAQGCVPYEACQHEMKHASFIFEKVYLRLICVWQKKRALRVVFATLFLFCSTCATRWLRLDHHCCYFVAGLLLSWQL